MTDKQIKYIIKNCPAFCDVDDDWDCISRDTEELKCQDCTDCLLKQIVEKCRSEQVECPCNDDDETRYYCWECEKPHRASLATEILSMLEIEECEE